MSIIHSKSPITLIGGGPVDGLQIAQSLKIAPLVVAADGGANNAADLSVPVHHIIGDMDSVDLSRTRNAELHPIAEQLSTDFDKCLYSTDAPLYLAHGFLGGRIDHQLAAFHTITKSPDKNVILIGDQDICFLAPPSLNLILPIGTRVSLFPMAEVTGTSNGLKWPIDNCQFSPDKLIGTSNETTVEHIQISLDQRKALLILPAEHLNTLLHQHYQTLNA